MGRHYTQDQKDARRENEDIDMLYRELKQNQRDDRGQTRTVGRNWDAFEAVRSTSQRYSEPLSACASQDEDDEFIGDPLPDANG